MTNPHSTYQFLANPQEESRNPGRTQSVNPSSSSYLDSQYPDSLGSDLLSIALIGPDEKRREAVASALGECSGSEVREFSSYPPSLDDVPRLLEQYYDVIIIDLDSDPEYALELVESICAKDSATVMVYSSKADRDLLIRSMRAGAREYLTLPFAQSTVAEALVRAAALHMATRPAKKTGGKLLVFLGTKGGAGVTTVACNFAVALALESGESTLLIDLGLPLGDVALNLGIVTEYSTVNAFQNSGRLDSSLLSKLVVKHSSGVSVLAAPGKFPAFQATNEDINKLMSVARQDFDNVVVDVGSRLDFSASALFRDASTVYMVTQAGIPELRNSNRLISQFFTESKPNVEVVINRYEPRSLGFSEEQITKALTRPAQWKIPNDYAAARQMQNTATPLMLEDSPISRLIRQMARSVCGLPEAPERKAGFSLRNLSRRITEKIFITDGMPSITDTLPSSLGSEPEAIDGAHVLGDFASNTIGVAPHITWPAPAPITCGTGLSSAQLNATSASPGTFIYTPGAGYVLPAGTHTLWATFTPANASGDANVQTAVSITVSKAAPSIKWLAPPVIPCGTPLTEEHLNASALIPGSFSYMPGLGETLASGKHTLSVTFTPIDTANYTSAQASVTVTVARSTPTISWTAPEPIPWRTALSVAQLNAISSAPGKFEYSPAIGEILAAGTHQLSATFYPEDTNEYDSAHSTVTLTVTKATPSVTWTTPAPITYGNKLGASHLDAVSTVPGTFVYSPAAGEMLPAGQHNLSVVFNPADATDYTSAQTTVSLTVTKATPAIAWSTPAPITYGTKLSSAELGAKASVGGTFVYAPPLGAVLGAGTHTPLVTFTPNDTANYTRTQAAVSLTVTKAVPTIEWPAPAPITDGAALNAAQLNATASVAGTFTYDPPAGTVLEAGTQTISVAFTPTESTNYTAAQAQVSITVTKAARTEITWPTPRPVPYGTALSATELNASAPVEGTFIYVPSAGTVLASGSHMLSVTFIPAESAQYSKAQSTVSLVVEGLPDLDSLLTAGTNSSFAPAEMVEQTVLPEASQESFRTESRVSQRTQPERERRSYKGATYEKGEDGQWHLLRK